MDHGFHKRFKKRKFILNKTLYTRPTKADYTYQYLSSIPKRNASSQIFNHLSFTDNTVTFNMLVTLYMDASIDIQVYLCEVSITDLPSLTMLVIQSQRNLLAPGSIPVVGSS